MYISTNIVIKSRYTLLNLRARRLEKRLKKFLKPISHVVIDEINAEHGTGYQYSDVVVEKFDMQTPTNESENIANDKVKAETKQTEVNTILNVAVQIGDKKAVQLICEELDIDFEEIKDELDIEKEEQNLLEAKKTLEGVVVDEETIIPEGAE